VERFVDWWGAKPSTEIQNGADNFSSFRNVQSTASRCSIADWKVVWPTSARVIAGFNFCTSIFGAHEVSVLTDAQFFGGEDVAATQF
jgi:hypothetical protein